VEDAVLRGFHPIKTASSTSKINSTENSKPEEENENYKTLPPELNSPFNERAVDCGPNSERTSERAVDCPAYDRSFSLERGGKLSNLGYDVIRTVGREEEEGGGRREEEGEGGGGRGEGGEGRGEGGGGQR
jgi:hypothetical protein